MRAPKLLADPTGRPSAAAAAPLCATGRASHRQNRQNGDGLVAPPCTMKINPRL